MSPTHFAVRMADIDRRIAQACAADNIEHLQQLISEQTALLRAMYGQLVEAP